MELRFIERIGLGKRVERNVYERIIVKILQQKIDGVWVDIPCVSEENEY